MNHVTSSPSLNVSSTTPFLINRDYGITGSEPSVPCAEPPVLNEGDEFAKSTFTFSRINRKTQTKEISKLIELAGQRVFDDLYLVGSSQLELQNMRMTPTMPERELIRTGAVRRQMSALRQRFYRELATMTWAGDDANDVGTGYKEFNGLTKLISADYGTDATLVTPESGTQADAAVLNSTLLDFGGVCVGGDTAPSLYEYLYSMADQLDQKAFLQGVEITDLKIVMRRQLWSEIVKYMFSELAADGVTSGNINVTDGRAGLQAQNYRDRMMAGQRLILNGKSYPVVFDDFIPLSTGTDVATSRPYVQSDIYFITNQVAGVNGDVIDTFDYKYRDYRALHGTLDYIGDSKSNAAGWTDGGRYHLIIEELYRCFQVNLLTEVQMRLTAPHLCGRLQNVRVCPLLAKVLPNQNP
jgi:hypothetical protein